jgi:cell division protein FtsA
MRDVATAARNISLPPERVILHSIAQHYAVDDQEGVVNPEGMEGSRLELNMLIVHAEGALLRNTMRTAQSVGVEVADVAFGGLCAALGALTPQQKAGGVLVLNLGGGTTEYLVYANQTVASAGVIAVGGDHVTNDVAIGLRIPLAQAEQLKIDHGAAEPDPTRRRQMVSLPAESGFSGQTVCLDDLHLIMHARLRELLRIVKKELERQGVIIRLGAGIVLTGGGALTRRLPELASREFNLPCVLGRPRGVSGLAVAGGPEYATLVGLLRYAQICGARSSRTGFGGWIWRLLRGQGGQTG